MDNMNMGAEQLQHNYNIGTQMVQSKHQELAAQVSKVSLAFSVFYGMLMGILLVGFNAFPVSTGMKVVMGTTITYLLFMQYDALSLKVDLKNLSGHYSSMRIFDKIYLAAFIILSITLGVFAQPQSTLLIKTLLPLLIGFVSADRFRTYVSNSRVEISFSNIAEHRVNKLNDIAFPLLTTAYVMLLTNMLLTL